MHSSFDFNISRARVLIREKSVAAIIAIAAAALFMFGSQTRSIVEAQAPSGTPYNVQTNNALSGGISYQGLSDRNNPAENAAALPSANPSANLLAQSPGYNNSSTMLSAGASVPTGLQTCTFRFAWTGSRHAWRGQIEVVNPSNPSAPGAVLEATSLGLEADQESSRMMRKLPNRRSDAPLG